MPWDGCCVLAAEMKHGLIFGTKRDYQPFTSSMMTKKKKRLKSMGGKCRGMGAAIAAENSQRGDKSWH
jgi:hypothetical protein